MKSFKKWEISVMVGVAATIVWCAASPRIATQWWTTAFAPLCDGILSSGDGGEIVLRSWFWEMLRRCVF